MMIRKQIGNKIVFQFDDKDEKAKQEFVEKLSGNNAADKIMQALFEAMKNNRVEVGDAWMDVRAYLESEFPDDFQEGNFLHSHLNYDYMMNGFYFIDKKEGE